MRTDTPLHTNTHTIRAQKVQPWTPLNAYNPSSHSATPDHLLGQLGMLVGTVVAATLDALDRSIVDPGGVDIAGHQFLQFHAQWQSRHSKLHTQAHTHGAHTAQNNYVYS
eukprot:1142168-Pelagomonas_calceolata.AAC.4